ncbi:MAG TPA: FtsX-like permease family protein [Bryobacteraceae bacterium]|jgi:predicted permease|nr:FtsX-like permease family protein [Bryobacteraceae bacterium]
MGVSGFLLLIVCANLANLILVRGMEQRRQISLSMALGAQGPRLVRQVLTESILLSLFGGLMGLAVAFAGARLILHFAFSKVSSVPINASPSIPVLLFAFGVSIITGLAFGIAPAWMATRVDPMEALRGTSRTTTRTGSLPRKVLVVFQAALSLVLLSAAGLFTAALHGLENQELGFDADRRIVMNIEPRLAGYEYRQLTPLYQRIQETLSRIPGVTGVALSTYMPQDTYSWGGYVWLDRQPGNNRNLAFWDRVTPGYSAVIGNRIMRGRGITDEDTAASRHVAVINEAFARKFFKNEDPVGKHFGREGIGSERQYEIVGVPKDIRNLSYSLDKPVDPLFSAGGPTRFSAGNRIGRSLSWFPFPTQRRCHDQTGHDSFRDSSASCDRFGRPQSAGHIDSHFERTSSRRVPAAAADCAAHFLLWIAVARAGLNRAIWSHCL